MRLEGSTGLSLGIRMCLEASDARVCLPTQLQLVPDAMAKRSAAMRVGTSLGLEHSRGLKS